jgi:hypothetical protein
MRRDITLRKIVRGPSEEQLDTEFWERVTPNERFAEAWRLSEEIWRLKGWDPGEPGFSRSTARVIRRGR